MGSHGNKHAIDRVLYLDGGGCAPLYVEVELLVHEPHFGAERRLAAEGEVDQRLQERDVRSAERMASGFEYIERLAALEQNRLLRLVDDQLRPCAQFAVGVFPREYVWTAVVLDD